MAIPDEIAKEVIDPKAYGDWDRSHAAFAWLRKNAPLDVATIEGFDPFWVVTRHADILNIERQNDLFHNEDRSATLTTIEADRRVREMMGGSPNILRSLVQMDNPDHMQYRRLTQSWFMPQNLRGLEDRIREIARGFIDKMAAKGTECDFARDVAFLYPLHVIMEVLGVPAADEPRMLKLTQELFGTQDPDVNRAGKELDDAGDALKMINETKKIFSDNTINVTATTVRIPTMGGHSESVNVEFKEDFDLAEVRSLLENAPGIIVQDDPTNFIYPMPITSHKKDEVFVGRLRRDESQPNTLNMWVVADNLRKGAATNAVQIAEYLLENKLT